MGEIRRGFTREFKVEAVRQVVEGERTVVEVARDLEISRNVLYRWKRQVTAETDESAGPGGSALVDAHSRDSCREPPDVWQSASVLRVAGASRPQSVATPVSGGRAESGVGQ